MCFDHGGIYKIQFYLSIPFLSKGRLVKSAFIFGGARLTAWRRNFTTHFSSKFCVEKINSKKIKKISRNPLTNARLSAIIDLTEREKARRISPTKRQSAMVRKQAVATDLTKIVEVVENSLTRRKPCQSNTLKKRLDNLKKLCYNNYRKKGKIKWLIRTRKKQTQRKIVCGLR